MPTETGPRAESSRRTCESIIAATVHITARERVAAISHRRVAAEADVALSSTTWHFATKADILEAALRWTADREVERIGAIADHLAGTDFDLSAWADELGDWLLEQVTTEREVAVALNGSRSSCSAHPAPSRCTASGANGCSRSASGCSSTRRRQRPKSTCG